jgi:hypothetical protein
VSAREAVIAEIKDAPDSLVQEAYDFVLFLKSRMIRSNATQSASTGAKPDFLARQKALFGDRTLPDSQSILDELRADRF